MLYLRAYTAMLKGFFIAGIFLAVLVPVSPSQYGHSAEHLAAQTLLQVRQVQGAVCTK